MEGALTLTRQRSGARVTVARCGRGSLQMDLMTYDKGGTIVCDVTGLKRRPSVLSWHQATASAAAETHKDASGCGPRSIFLSMAAAHWFCSRRPQMVVLSKKTKKALGAQSLTPAAPLWVRLHPAGAVTPMCQPSVCVRDGGEDRTNRDKRCNQ